MYENSAALAQYNHIKETEKKSDHEVTNKKVDLLDLEMAANMIEDEETFTALPQTYLGFGKLSFS